MQETIVPAQQSFFRRFFKLRYLLGLVVVGCTLAVLSMLPPARVAANDAVTVHASGITVSVEPVNGDYSVVVDSTGWTFSGSVGQRIAGPQVKADADHLGKYRGIVFNWDDKGPVAGEIRAYTDRPAVMFVLTCKTARPAVPRAFPSLVTPPDLHPFGYANTVFSPRSFKGGEGASPWLLFDDSARAVILSPAANFMTAQVLLDKQKNLNSGLNHRLANLPEGFTHQTLLVPGDSIHQAWDRWGHDLTDLAGKTRPANDQEVELRQFGYWTDNGANYYYKFDPARGYDGTLLDVDAAFKKLGIPLGYMQLDSWWYFKSKTGPNGKEGKDAGTKNARLPAGDWNCYGGLMKYQAHPALFPQGLAAFDKQLGIPLITHNRWVDLNSPYRQQYNISGVAAIDPKWWDKITDYLKASGVVVYEQDWLNEIYSNSPQFSTTTTAGDAFMDNMARATRERGMRIQYCMELPQHFLQGSKYDNLTSVRVADDRFEHGKWDAALYTSHMATSLGEWPWVDTFNSGETANLTLATLTAGPVGVGDAMDQIDAKNIGTCIRADGVIVKPDTAIVPLDQTYVSDAGDKKSPMIAAAYTDHGSHRTAYVFCFPRSAAQTQIAFRPADLGISTDAWVYEPSAAKGKLVAANGSFNAEFAEPNHKKAWSYFVVSPVGSSGIALVGDAGKIVTAGRQRVAEIEETASETKVTVAFAVTEKSVTLTGFAQDKPVVTAESGSVGSMTFDENTHQFIIEVAPAAGEHPAAVVRLARK
jgi:hypothetical protein